ncbi:MAG: HAD-IIB family hydrolase [Trueperaceae bacterium]|nr:HAD-IIB family hydrolase [Trueperaceae bacterium]
MKQLNIHLYSIHGLIRGENLELGRDADTGGQTKYLVEFARALGEHPDVAQVNLFTRQVVDKRVSSDYAKELEPLSEKARIVRIKAGPKRYLRKELLWPHLDEFVDNSLRFIKAHDAMPDLVHGHYADAAYVASEIAGYLGVPFLFTGHSLGRNKLQVLKNAGHSEEAIEEQYHISQRISVEEEALRKADIVIASTQHEVKRGYELYEGSQGTHFKVIPPGINVETFYPYYYDLDTSFEPEEAIVKARVRMQREINRFLRDPKKPLILAVSRPDRRKNIDGLVTAYGEDKELQAIANLAVFAGVRSDIQTMDDNEQDVLTQMLLLMDKYDLYGKMALPKKHQPDTDIPVLYRLAAASKGVFINPALVENFGITLIEASSSGLPIVSTDHGGPQDIIANCESGILINAKDTNSIQAALKSILVDSEHWESFSANGISGVRKHYSWKAHAESYMTAINDLIDKNSITDASWRSKIGRHLTRVNKVLISDIDYTLIHEGGNADEAALKQLKASLENSSIGFGVATGRSLELVKDVLENYDLPQPDIVVCAVGSEIYYGKNFIPDHGYAQHISYGWKPGQIKKVLAGLPFLTMQEAENQKPFKLSYYMEQSADNLAKIHATLSDHKLRYNLIYSHGQFLDILPHRASKGKAIRYLSHKWGITADNIAVAGDSGNDEEMLRGNFRGIVVGNYAEELEILRGKNRIYFADGHYAAGVIEGLEHYQFLNQ